MPITSCVVEVVGHAGECSAQARTLGGRVSGMHVATLRVELLIPDAYSLKDKRKVVRSVIDRTRHRFRVAAAEVEANDVHNLAVLGFAA